MKIKNNKFVTKNNLLLLFDQNNYINKLFNYTDPNCFASILQVELNTIVNTLALPKIAQFKSAYTPYIDDKMRKNMDFNKNLLDTAIRTHGIEDWREFKNNIGIINKQFKKLKSYYTKHKFKNKNNRYRFLKNFNGTNKQQVPSNVSYNN